MSNKNSIHHQPFRGKSLDLTSEGVLPLIQDLLHSGFHVRIKVSGRSMIPFLEGNEIVTMRKISPLMLKKGAIVFFVNDEGNPILHRIVRIKQDTNNNVMVQTKGDGLVGLDAPVDVSRILGCVSRVEVRSLANDGKITFSCRDLTVFRHKLIAAVIARRELFFYYCRRIVAKIVRRG